MKVNNYGTSTLRSELRSMAKSTNYFTDAQQALMNKTTITTKDNRNNNGNYTTTDVLYAAYGNNIADEQHITVGTNKEIAGDLNNGLKIDRQIRINGEDVNIWGDKSFWLRTPGSNDDYALDGIWDSGVNQGGINVPGVSVVPAFNLNLTDVLFASTAPAATGSLTSSMDIAGNTMTFRWTDKENKIKSTAICSPKGVSVTKGNNETGNVYLCVQGNNESKDWIWAKEVSGNVGDKTIFLADEIRQGADLSNCQVWLETTVDGLTYAEQPEDGYIVNITAGADSGLEITSGNGRQIVAQGSAIADIIVTLKTDEYYLSDKTKFIQDINQKLAGSGLRASETDKGFKISGTPAKDVQNVLPAAALKQKAQTPAFSSDNITRTKNSLTVTGNFAIGTYGKIQYKWDGATSWTESNSLSGLVADTKHTVAIRYAGNGIYLPSDPTETLTISTLKDGAMLIQEPTGLTGTYGQKLSDVKFPADSGWSWENGDTGLQTGKHSYAALFSTTTHEGNYDFSSVAGYDGDSHFVKRSLTVQVGKATPQYELPTGLTIKQGEALSTLDLTPYGFSWVNGSQTADVLGVQDFAAIYTPEDTENYTTVEVKIRVEVVSGETPVNHPPVFAGVADKTLTVGDTFHALDGVTATDEEDGDLTDQIEVSGTVDTSKAGRYAVTYKVADSQGAAVAKTITVTVNPKEDAGSPQKPDGTTGNGGGQDGNQSNSAAPHTGDDSSLALWIALLLASLAGACGTVWHSRKTRRRK